MEIWRDIKGYEGLYQVSDKGNVRSLDRVITMYNGGSYIRKGRVLKQMENHQGYMRVHILRDGISKTKLVHRLVAEAFIPNPNGYKEVNHKDENKFNNSVSNLEWCTQQYNKTYGTARLRARQKLMKKVNQYDLDGNFIKTWDSLKQIERETGIKTQGIGYCCAGKRKQHGGYIWKFYNE